VRAFFLLVKMMMQQFVPASNVKPILPVGQPSRKKKGRRSDRKKLEEFFWKAHAGSFDILFVMGIALFIAGLVILIVFSYTNYYAEFRIRHKINKLRREINETLELFQRVEEKNQALGYAGLNQHTQIPAHQAPDHEILDAIIPGAGEASFISDGTGLIRTMKILKPGSNVNLSETDNVVTISAMANGTDDFEFIDATAPNLTDATLISFPFGPMPELKILRSGGNVSITETGTVVTINSGDLNGTCNTTCFESVVPVEADNGEEDFVLTLEATGIEAVPDNITWVIYKLGQIVLFQLAPITGEGRFDSTDTGALSSDTPFITEDFVSTDLIASLTVFPVNMMTTNANFITGTCVIAPSSPPPQANLLLLGEALGTFPTIFNESISIPAPGPGGLVAWLQTSWAAIP